MKKFFAILFSLIGFVSFAQVNETVDSMFVELNKLGIGYMKTQSFAGKGVTIQYNAEPERQSVKNFDKGIDLMRRTFDEIAVSANESFRYETHKNGIDTIQYSLCLAPGSIGKREIHNNRAYYNMMKETVNFDYYSVPEQFSYAKVSYKYVLDEPEYSDEKAFGVKEYEEKIKPILERPEVKSRNIGWKYGEKDAKGDALKARLMEGTSLTPSGTEFKGETNGMVYSLPLTQKKLAMELLSQLSEASYAFICEHPHQTYTYQFNTIFSFNKVEELLKGSYSKDPFFTSDMDYQISVVTVRDKDGYHFVVLHTDGWLEVVNLGYSVK